MMAAPPLNHSPFPFLPTEHLSPPSLVAAFALPLLSQDEDILDYEDEIETQVDATAAVAEKPKGSYAGMHTSGFRDFLLKPELLRAIVDCGFEHPSEGRVGSRSRRLIVVLLF